MKKKTRAQLEAELEAANKRCADLADALVKVIQAQPVYVPYVVPYHPQPFQPWWHTVYAGDVVLPSHTTYTSSVDQVTVKVSS